MMRRLLLIALCVGLGLGGLTGCSGAEKKKDEPLTQTDGRVPEFFSYIPADSPYVMTGIDPVPLDMYEPLFSQYGEVYAQYAEELERMREANPGGYNPQDEVFVDFAIAFLEEFGGNLDAEGFARLGMSMRPRMALYGLGVLPVFRMSLADPAKFEAFVVRLETRGGVKPMQRKLGEATYRVYEVSPGMFVPLAITDDEVVVAFAPEAVLETVVSYMLGQTRPEKSLADVDTVQDLIATYGLHPSYVGWFDIDAVTGVLIGATQPDPLMKAGLDALEFPAPTMPQACVDEIMAMANAAPRAVVGYKTLTEDRIEMLMGLEITGDFASRLSKTRAPLPAYDSPLVERALGAVGVGVDLKAFADFVEATAAKIDDQPFSCPELQEFNEMARQARHAPAQIPNFLLGLNGATVIVDKIDLDPQTYEANSVQAIAVIDHEDPVALLSQLQMFVPQLQGVTVKTDGVPVALQPFDQYPMLQVPHVAMDADTLAFSVGVGMQDEMAVHFENGGGQTDAQTPIGLFAYDYAKLMEVFAPGGQTGGPMGGPMMGPNFAMMGLTKAFGTLVVTLDADPRGLFMRYSMEIDQSAAAEPAQPAGQGAAAP